MSVFLSIHYDYLFCSFRSILFFSIPLCLLVATLYYSFNTVPLPLTFSILFPCLLPRANTFSLSLLSFIFLSISIAFALSLLFSLSISSSFSLSNYISIYLSQFMLTVPILHLTCLVTTRIFLKTTSAPAVCSRVQNEHQRVEHKIIIMLEACVLL